MKKIYSTLLFSAIAAISCLLSSCNKTDDINVGNVPVTVEFFANSIQTKTAFTDPTGTSYPTLWTTNDETVKILQNIGGSPQNATVTPDPGYATAKFTASITSDESGSYTFYGFSPASAFSTYKKEYKDYNLTVKQNQTPSAKSVDEDAMILVGKSSVYAPDFPTTVEMDFSHITAYGKLTMINLDTVAGEIISTVKLTAEIPWVGSWWYYVEDYDTYSAGDWSPAGTAKTELFINTSSSSDIWFACAPVDLGSKTIDILVTTNKATYAKQITIPAGKKFISGKIASFTVDMASATKDVAPVYSLTPATGGSNGYATLSEDLSIDGIKWNVVGNTTLTPWRLGGKGSAKRYLYSEDPLNADIKKIVISHGAANDITVNSMTVYVCSTPEGAAVGATETPTDVVASFTPSFAANDDVVVSKVGSTSWENCYYRIVYDITVSGTKNKYFEFKQAKFYD